MAEENQKELVNDICRDCLKWEKFGQECFVHWHGKKDCSHRVVTMDEWQEEKLLR